MAAGRVKGLFLDLDGTLAISGALVRQTYLDFLGQYGRQGSQAEYEGLLARPIRDWVAELKARYGLTPPLNELYQAFEGLLEGRYPQLARPAPGALELLQAARAQGVATVVVTSAARKLARGFLEQHGLAGLIAAMVAAEDVAQGKPHPEPYLKALSLTELAPEQALAVEDSPHGASSALAAGLTTYLIAPAAGPQGLALLGLAGKIKSLMELVPLLG